MLVIIALLALSLLSITHAVKLPLTRRAQTTAFPSSAFSTSDSYASNSSGLALFDTDSSDTGYFVIAEIGAFRVLIDTGSSDLWVYKAGTTVKTTNMTTVPVDIEYGEGSAVLGTVAFTELKLGHFNVSSQAFIDVTQVDIVSNLLDLADGLIGLSFDSQSNVNLALTEAYGSETTLGKTPLSNIFAQNPSMLSCVDMHLYRTIDLERVINGTLFIGEHSETYPNIVKQPVFYTVLEDEWAILLSGMAVNNKDVSLSVRGLPTDSPVHFLPTLIDSGNTNGAITVTMFNAIYSSMPGAVQLNQSQWIVPCLSSTNVTFTFGGLDYPIHPLDLTVIVTAFDANQQTNVTYCTSQGFQVIEDWNEAQGSLALGDTLLKNVYASFNFGNLTNSSTPNNGSYIQFISTTNATQAWRDFQTTRAQTLKTLPPEVDVQVALSLASNAAQATMAAASSSSSSPLSATFASIIPSTTILPVGNTKSKSPSAKVDESPSKALGTLAEDTSNSDDHHLTSLVKMYGVTALGLLAANLAVGLILSIIGVLACMRGKRESRRTVNPTYAPVRFKELETASVVEGVRYED